MKLVSELHPPSILLPLALASSVLVFSAGSAVGGQPTASVQAENVLVLVVDDMGMEKTGAYGFLGTDGEPLAPKTPNIDRIAERGLLFRNAWAAPACSTCRASALTGTYPNRTGIGTRIPASIFTEEGLRADALTLPDILPPNYASAVVGKWHLAGNGATGSLTSGIDHAPRCGFDFHVGTKTNLGDDPIVYFDWTQIISFIANLAASQTVDLVGEYATTRVTNDALRAIDGFGGRPFFLWVSYHAPHKPFHVPPAHLVQSTDLDLTTDIGKGKAMIEALDAEIGRLLASMDPDVLARTTVIWFSDNGTQKQLVEPPWDPTKVKSTVYNGGVNVPFLVMGRRIPIQFRGQECERLIDITDLMPTVAEMLGVPAPVGVDGQSFLPYLSNPRATPRRDWIFAERFKPNFGPQGGTSISQVPLDVHDQAVRDQRYKLIRKRVYDNGGLLSSEELEFYDVELDYYELQDLLDSQGNPPAELQATFDGLLAILDQMAS